MSMILIKGMIHLSSIT